MTQILNMSSWWLLTDEYFICICYIHMWEEWSFSFSRYIFNAFYSAHLSVLSGWASSQSCDERTWETSEGCLFRLSMQVMASRGALLQHLCSSWDALPRSLQKTIWKLMNYHRLRENISLIILIQVMWQMWQNTEKSFWSCSI